MKDTTVKNNAQAMVMESITNNIEFSIEFYKTELKTQKANGNEHMVAHCGEMIKAYTTLKFMVNHFKF